MKIENMAAPSITQPHGAKATGEMTSVQRAVAKLEQLQASTRMPAQDAMPVPNPSKISPEEMTAIRPNQGQTNKVETSSNPEASEESKPSDEPLSSQYAILARKEKALRLRDQQLKQKEAALRAQEESSKAKPVAPAIDESKFIPKDRLLADPIKVLLEQGLTYEQLTEAALNGPRQEDLALQTELRALRDEIKALKGETESTKKSFEENQTAQRAQAERQIKSDVSRLVHNDEAFEMIKETNSIGDVVELITKTFDQDGILLTVEEAAQQVEEYLAEEALKLSRLKKIQQRLQIKAEAAPQKATGQPEQSQMKTLTNAVSSSRPLSAKERAMLAFERKLQK